MTSSNSLTNSYINTEEYIYQFAKQHIFLSGGLAVGKTTVINRIHDYFLNRDEIVFIREYIDFDSNGMNMLERLHGGLISNYEFQLYVLDCYEKQLNTIDYEEADIVLWERHPCEALYIFCKNDYTLTFNERIKIEMKLDSLCERYEIPKFGDKNIDYIDFDIIINDSDSVSNYLVGELIYPMLMGEYEKNVFVLLYCSNLEKQFERLTKRGRFVELESYKKKEDLLIITNDYFGFYLKYKNNLTIN
ncbi:hypothetical protein EDI_294360 [Entamoeba dispar SAW760]|uniref:Deoxynucleoside kinase domain-containing protein n=1 Tax=Entamoeba dispar (strain ATCC PRA-260 / SAW760) TaxID=370354 RepID=B0EC06_ENTDS|nr:uncharacterized protein EDI_294360 [Entamoeba dispar SAW760]EDR27935.1 hypothetical protein EDI_294360 [Entamoeba dispar SAW760]|eukprot:EDR27935.1 hypothetical protein EDI_294360 [Entamoeba dispar SAW760]